MAQNVYKFNLAGPVLGDPVVIENIFEVLCYVLIHFSKLNFYADKDMTAVMETSLHIFNPYGFIFVVGYYIISKCPI